MPIYESICLKCGKKHEYIKPSSQCHETPVCCKKKTEKRIFTVPAAQFDIQPWDSFISPATGKLITSKAERREDMKASGCRDWEGMDAEKQNAIACKKREEEQQDKQLEAAVVDAWKALPDSKKDILLNNNA